MPAKKLEKLLGPGSGGSLEKLIRNARDMDALTSAVRGALSPDMGENVVAANVRDNGELVIICTSPAWASRIRFEADALLAAAAEAGFTAGSVRVAVSQT